MTRTHGRRGIAHRPRFAARAGPRDQDPAQRDHRLRRDHRRPISRARRTAATATARREIVGQARLLLGGDRRPRFRRQARSRPRPRTTARSRPRRRCSRRSPTSLRALPRERRRGCSRSRSSDERLRCAARAGARRAAVRRLLPAVIEHAGEARRLRVAVVEQRHGAAGRSSARARSTASTRHAARPGVRPARRRRTSSAVGFALRLVRGLARIAGGDLRIDADALTSRLPGRSSADLRARRALAPLSPARRWGL